MTIGIPAAAGVRALSPAVDDETAVPVFAFDRWVNKGGGHVYEDRFEVYRVRFEDQSCSCGVLGYGEADGLMDLRLLPYLSRLACDLGEVQFVIHEHHGSFDSEPFAIRAGADLLAADVTPDTVFARDTRYTVRCEGPSNKRIQQNAAS